MMTFIDNDNRFLRMIRVFPSKLKNYHSNIRIINPADDTCDEFLLTIPR